MASNTSRRSLTLATPRQWKHRHLAGAVAVFRRNGDQKKHSNIGSPVNFSQSVMKNEISARKLAAGLWQLRFVEDSEDGGADTKDGSFPSSKLANGNHRDQNSEEKFKSKQDEPISRRPSVTILRSRNGLLCELEASMACHKSPKEEATKWNPTSNEATNKFTRVHKRKLLEDIKLEGSERDFVVTVLLEELLQAKNSINILKAAHKSSKKKANQLLQTLEEEKVLWKRRQHHKIKAMSDKLKGKLSRERRSRERIEKVNEKLVNELAAANESAKLFMTNYEKEKRERELTEEVCDELAQQLGKEKAKFEVLMWEVEEEREMMRITDQLREERVYMKLSDAKDLVEEKHNQMVQLISHLQMLLRSKGNEDSQLNEAIESVINFGKIIEFFYDLSKSKNEELKKHNENSYPTLTGPLSTIIHIENVDEEGLKLNKNYMSYQSSGLGGTPNSPEFCHEEDKFGTGPQMVEGERDTCVINVNQPNDETTMIADTRYSQYRYILGDGWKKLKEAKNSIEGGAGTSNSSTNNIMNPHITRGMRGCIEWPRGISKANSKTIPLEERVKSHKSQLQHILKQKP